MKAQTSNANGTYGKNGLGEVYNLGASSAAYPTDLQFAALAQGVQADIR